jgi:hypothetical protein
MACDRQVTEKIYPLANGRKVKIIVRSAVVPEDPYINLARAAALSLRTLEPNIAKAVDRGVKDFLIKTNITPR